jgi:hypothetical protein
MLLIVSVRGAIGHPRTIVAKFEKRKDRERVLGVAKTGVLRRTDFGVNEQYPKIITEDRRLFQNCTKRDVRTIALLLIMISYILMVLSTDHPRRTHDAFSSTWKPGTSYALSPS